MTRNPFARRLLVILLGVCLLLAPIAVPAEGGTNGSNDTNGNDSSKKNNVNTNSGGSHDDDDDDDDDNDDDDCECCRTLPADVAKLETDVAALKTEVAKLKEAIAAQGTSSGCPNVAQSIVRAWAVSNPATGSTGVVNFTAGGTYVIVSGTYNAGGSWAGKSTGTYSVLEGGAIAFTYTGSSSTDRIAVVQCTENGKIIHFVLGHTLDYEILTPAVLE